MRALFLASKQINAHKLAQFFFLLFVFTVPFQIQTFLFQEASYETGQFNPFVSFFITFADLSLLASLFCTGLALYLGQFKFRVLSEKQKKLSFYILLFLGSFELSLFLADSKEISLLYSLRFWEFFLFYLLFSFRLVSFSALKRTFLLSVLFQSFLALFQYLDQGSLSFSFLGEPSLSSDAMGVAKMNYTDNVLIRPYGTFVHPNLLAAYLLVAIFLSIFSWKKDPPFYISLLVVFFLMLLLSFSRSAWLAFLTASLFYFAASNKKIPYLYLILGFSLALLFVVAFDLYQALLDAVVLRTGIVERFELLDTAKRIFYANPFGVGLGNFTLSMQEYWSAKLNPWDLQPVHNVFFLILIEGGIIALICFLLLAAQVFRFVFRYFKRYKRRVLASILLSIWAAFFVLSLFDHYLISLYQGQFLFWFYLAMVSHYLEFETTPLANGSTQN